MRILILGGGGREHALAWRLAQDAVVEQVVVSPGNAGMSFAQSANDSLKIHITGQEPTFDTIDESLHAHRISLVIIGPEKYLFEGYADRISQLRVPVLGPSQAAAFLESSKIRSKQLMRAAGVPTAHFEVAKTLDEALILLEQPQWSNGVVLKVSGPAAGKGVFVCHSDVEAKEVIGQMKKHPPPGIEEGLLLEEKLIGREVSLFYLCHENRSLFIGSACDHKRLLNQDQGPNTGGMGTFSPDGRIPERELASIEERFIKPTLREMVKQETPFQGVLFLG
ncbi:MAG: phosphoribosylamine--glycine ligase, partial [Proteobacteria bacterium]